eukprot:SAG11_NODE_1111_length_5823_cov_2.384172_2_plen_407_part_00
MPVGAPLARRVRALTSATPSAHRRNLWLRHGLSPDTGLEALRGALSIAPAVDFTLRRLEGHSAVQMEGSFEPAVTYTITVADDDSVRDGFGLPLVGGGSAFETADRPSFFLDAGSYGNSDAIFPLSAGKGLGFPSEWSVLSQGEDQCLMSYQERRDDPSCTDAHPPKYVEGFAVRPTVPSIKGAIASLYNDGASFPDEDAPTARAAAALSASMAAVGFEAEPLLADSGLFVHSRYDTVNYHGNLQKTSALAGVTELDATFVMSSTDHMTAWLTLLTDNTDAAGATVSLFEVSQTYRCEPSMVTVIATATTGGDGLATLDLSAASTQYSTLVAAVIYNGASSGTRTSPVSLPIGLAIKADRACSGPGRRRSPHHHPRHPAFPFVQQWRRTERRPHHRPRALQARGHW